MVVSDSSPLITLARVEQLHLLRDFYGEVVIRDAVHWEVTVNGAGLPGAEEVQRASWIRVHSCASEPPPAVVTACAGLGAGEKSAIYLGHSLAASFVLIDEARARRAAKRAGLAVAGSIAVLERGARLMRLADLRSTYFSLLKQGIRFERKLLNESLGRLGMSSL